MKGLWLEERKLTLRYDLPRPEPAADESLVRVLVAGICNTDIELTGGYYPFAVYRATSSSASSSRALTPANGWSGR